MKLGWISNTMFSPINGSCASELQSRSGDSAPAMHGGVMEIALAALADAAQTGKNSFLDI